MFELSERKLSSNWLSRRLTDGLISAGTMVGAVFAFLAFCSAAQAQNVTQRVADAAIAHDLALMLASPVHTASFGASHESFLVLMVAGLMTMTVAAAAFATGLKRDYTRPRIRSVRT